MRNLTITIQEGDIKDIENLGKKMRKTTKVQTIITCIRLVKALYRFISEDGIVEVVDQRDRSIKQIIIT